MFVYILEHRVRYESGQCLAVYSTVDKALSEAKARAIKDASPGQSVELVDFNKSDKAYITTDDIQGWDSAFIVRKFAVLE